MSNAKPTGDHPLHVLGLFGFLSIISVCILFFVLLPPLNDYPNHLARAYILANVDHSVPLQRYYRSVMFAQPNLAMDLIVPFLAKTIPLEFAGKLFIALTIILTAGGVLTLHYVIHRRWSVWPCIAFLFSYHRMLLWGLLNFCFGLAVALYATAFWIFLRSKPIWLRILGSSVGATTVYFCHLYAFGIYALTVAGIELRFLTAARSKFDVLRNVLLALPQFLAPAYLFVFLSGARSSVPETKWGPIWRKLEAPFDVIYQYHLTFDVACLLVITGLVAWGIWQKRVTVARQMVPTTLLLIVVFLAMPDELLSGDGADRRFPIAILLLAIAACDWNPRKIWWREPVALAMIALFVARMALLAEVWHKSDQVYAQYFKAIDLLPRGARVLPITLHPDAESLQQIPLLEGACLAIVRRDAFVPSLFVSPPLAAESVSFAPNAMPIGIVTHFHIFLRADIAQLGLNNGAGAMELFRRKVVSQFDYVFVTRADVLPPNAIPSSWAVVSRTPSFTLYKVRR